MKTVIIYNSKTGTTKRYAEAIGEYLSSNKMNVSITSIEEYQPEILKDANYLLLGCWTQGLLFFNQHPEKAWVEFAKKLPEKINTKVILFTTYKILTGSMFRKMYAHLNYIYNFL